MNFADFIATVPRARSRWNCSVARTSLRTRSRASRGSPRAHASMMPLGAPHPMRAASMAVARAARATPGAGGGPVQWLRSANRSAASPGRPARPWPAGCGGGAGARGGAGPHCPGPGTALDCSPRGSPLILRPSGASRRAPPPQPSPTGSNRIPLFMATKPAAKSKRPMALGMVETKGLVGAIEAADAMVKAAMRRALRTRARVRRTRDLLRPGRGRRRQGRPPTPAPPRLAAWASWSACT